MYTSFEIKNFRCFEYLTIEPLARVNLIAGKNNSGKTALLEALYLHTKPNNPRLGLQLAEFRGVSWRDSDWLLHDLFYNFGPKETIVLKSKGDWNGGPKTLYVRLQPREISEYPVTV